MSHGKIIPNGAEWKDYTKEDVIATFNNFRDNNPLEADIEALTRDLDIARKAQNDNAEYAQEKTRELARQNALNAEILLELSAAKRKAKRADALIMKLWKRSNRFRKKYRNATAAVNRARLTNVSQETWNALYVPPEDL
jgi:spore coat polysaccharide biosynthesis protein SpsF (cytidylyltransferase family)